jgi:hypothetical protein
MMGFLPRVRQNVNMQDGISEKQFQNVSWVELHSIDFILSSSDTLSSSREAYGYQKHGLVKSQEIDAGVRMERHMAEAEELTAL